MLETEGTLAMAGNVVHLLYAQLQVGTTPAWVSENLGRLHYSLLFERLDCAGSMWVFLHAYSN